MSSREDPAAALPLSGVRAVSLAMNVPGPVAAARLATLGAQVTKVEPPAGDPLRQVAPDWYADLTAGQEVRVLDLKTEDGRAALLALLDGADLLLTSSRTSALARLGLGWDELHRALPGLCQVAIVGHPAPDDDLAGHDLTYQAATGTITPPAMPTVLVADLAGAERAVSEALAALLHRAAGGPAGYRAVALSEVAEGMAQPIRRGLTTPDGVLGGALPAYRIYEAASGHVALAALEPHFLARVTELLGVRGSQADFEAAFADRPAAEWEAWARQHDVPLAAVRAPGR